MDAFLLMGRSNRFGRGKISEVPPICDTRIFMLRNGHWQSIHWDGPLWALDLQRALLRKYVRAFKGEAGLISCAVGSADIEE